MLIDEVYFDWKYIISNKSSVKKTEKFCGWNHWILCNVMCLFTCLVHEKEDWLNNGHYITKGARNVLFPYKKIILYWTTSFSNIFKDL